MKLLRKTTHQTSQHVQLTSLFRAARTGNSAAYNSFLATITPILRRVVARKIHPNDVEDTVQDILISIHKARHTHDGERPLMPWMMAIAHFRIIDALRKTYKNASHTFFNEDEINNVTEHAYNSEYEVDEIFYETNERDKQILTLMHVEGYTAKETGSHLGLKESAVKVAAHRALKKIRARLKV